MSKNNTERTLGKLLASVDSLDRNIGEVKTTLAAHGEKIDALQSKFDQAKGGWKALAVIGALAGTVGGLVGRFWGAPP